MKTYYPFLDKIYVFDNSENIDHAHWFQDFKKVQYFGDGKNEGLAKRLNQAARIAILEGFEWLLTMDQDSHFESGSFEMYENCIAGYREKDKVALFGTAWGREFKTSSPACTAETSAFVITSGSFVNLKVFKEVGGFDENLFIDLIDHEYAKRAELAGFPSIQFNNVYLRHELGQQVNKGSIKSFYLLKKKKIVHSPIRCYYMYRNMLYVEKKFKQSDPVFTQKMCRIVKSGIQNTLLYGPKTIEVVKYIQLAKKDFQSGKMGKLETPL